MADEIKNFLDMMAAEKGAVLNTLQAYHRDLEQFLDFCQGRDFSSSTIEKFVCVINRR